MNGLNCWLVYYHGYQGLGSMTRKSSDSVEPLVGCFLSLYTAKSDASVFSEINIYFGKSKSILIKIIGKMIEYDKC